MPTKLQEKQGLLDLKRKEMADIFDKYPNMDMEASVAADLKVRNDELTDISKEVEGLKEIEVIALENKRQLDEGNERKGGMSWQEDQKGGKTAPAQQKSIGELFIESKAFKEFSASAKKGPAADVEVERKLLDEAAWIPQAIRMPLVVPGVLARPVVADLMPQGTTSQYAIAYMEETTTTNAAASVLEGGAKPESNIAFTERVADVIEVATWLAITERLMEDAPAMMAYVNGRLNVFLQLAEENELLNGGGAAPSMRGLLHVVGLQTQAKGADPTPDAIYKAITKIQVGSQLSASGMVIHPTDWQDIRLLRTVDGIYIWGSPSEAGPERVWGLPIVKTTSIAENTGLVGAFDTAAQIFRRKNVTFEVSNSHSDFFVKNKLAIRCVERLAMPVYRPAAFCTVTGI